MARHPHITEIQSSGAGASQSALAPRKEFYEGGLEGTDRERSVAASGGERANHHPATAKMTVMTKPETALIADSWDLVAQDLKGHGLKFFKQ